MVLEQASMIRRQRRQTLSYGGCWCSSIGCRTSLTAALMVSVMMLMLTMMIMSVTTKVTAYSGLVAMNPIKPYVSSLARRRHTALRLYLQAGGDEEDNDEDKYDDSTSSDLSANQNNKENADPVFYDDFSGQTIGGTSSTSRDSSNTWSSSAAAAATSFSTPTALALQERIRSVQAQQRQQETLVFHNWQRGNWKVRGFSLDPEKSPPLDHPDDDHNHDPDGRIHVCLIQSAAAAKVNWARESSSSSGSSSSTDELIWIGRTDGSLLAVRLGSAYWTSFQSKLTAAPVDTDETTSNSENASTIIRISSQLVREDKEISAGTVEDDDDEEDDQVVAMPPVPVPPSTPFEIVAQVQAGETPLSAILVLENDDDDDSSSSTVWTACQGSGDIQQWKQQQEVGPGRDTLQLKRGTVLAGVHGTSTVITVQAVKAGTGQQEEDDYDDDDETPQVIFSAAADGSMALWDVATGALKYHCKLENTEIHSASTDGIHVFLGTATGQILVYKMQDWYQQSTLAGMVEAACPMPNGQWSAANDDVPITSLATAGTGTLGRTAARAGGAMESFVLLTGDANGVVKQWEVLSRRGGTRLEQWPKLASQRLSKKAHLFARQHEGAVTALASVDQTKFVSASADGTVRAWNTATGKEIFRMDGFTDQIRSVCLQSPTLLITDGMKQYVCVHDFDVDPNEYKEYDLEMDDEW